MGDRRDKLQHLFPEGVTSSRAFTAPGSARDRDRPAAFPQRLDPLAHARQLLRDLAVTGQRVNALEIARKNAALSECNGAFVDVEFQPNTDFPLQSLADERAGIELLAVTEPRPGRACATLFVPTGKLKVLESKINAFSPPPGSKEPRNKALVSSMESIRLAVAESFWTDPASPFPTTEGDHWWEVWIRKSVSEERFRRHARVLKLHVSDRELRFPDRTVFLVRASVAAITRSTELLDSIAELRRAVPVDIELRDLDLVTEEQLVADLAERGGSPSPTAPAVCVLDTGIDFEHPLLRRVANGRDIHTCFGEDVRDRYGEGDWHGTGAAGLAVYGPELAKALLARDEWQHTHHLESVKYLPSSGQNDPDLYGDITMEGVALAELKQPHRNRTIVTTVTAEQSPAGEPTSWSAAIDQLCAGSLDDPPVRRLMVLAAGNVQPHSDYTYPEVNQVSNIEDPAQAWNAITVGALTDRNEIAESEYARYKCVATSAGDLSPASRTSLTWIDTDYNPPPPFKPDFVCEGGNWARETADGLPTVLDSLSLLTTRRRDGVGARLLGRFCGTSAAAPIAARMAALLQAEYPNLWPETIRALLVHSCRYTDAMQARFTEYSGRQRAERLLRCFGYGVPDLEIARYSARNESTLVLEQEIQPFRFDPDAGKGKTHEMHVHRLPWPVDLLEQLGELEMRLRVTLSYFIEPNPGKRSVRGPARTKIVNPARYPSFGLRFAVSKPGENWEKLAARVNAADRIGKVDTRSDSQDWTLGSLCTRGSIHSDVWHGTAAKLADKGAIVIYPVSGWWRFRSKEPDVCERRARYALVVSIETDDVEVNVYTPIMNAIALER